MNNSQNSPDRFRNMAMLVAYLNNKMHKPNNMRSEVEKVLDQNDTVKGANAKYQEYIRKNVKEWS